MKNHEGLSHTRYDCKYHVVFIPKYRRKKIYGAIRRHLGEIFHELAKHKESRILERAFEGRSRPLALLHGPEQIADLPVPVAESPGAVRIGHPERSHLVEYLAPNSVFNSLPRQRSSPHLRPDDRLVTIDRVLHHASLGVA